MKMSLKILGYGKYYFEKGKVYDSEDNIVGAIRGNNGRLQYPLVDNYGHLQHVDVIRLNSMAVDGMKGLYSKPCKDCD